MCFTIQCPFTYNYNILFCVTFMHNQVHVVFIHVGKDVGVLPNYQHGIGGTVEILSTTRIRFRNFRYDGGGPCKSLLLAILRTCTTIANSITA